MARPYASYRGTPVPCVDAHEMQLIDQMMADDYGVSLAHMAESAGLALAALAFRMLRGHTGLPVVVLVGKGGNGSGAMIAARRLAAWGFKMHVVLSEAGLAEPSCTLRATLDSMGLPVTAYAAAYGQRIEEELRTAPLVIDGLVGYSLRGVPHGSVADLIRCTHGAARTLSLDVPSGLDPTTGVPQDPAVRAEATLTIALPKSGLLKQAARPHVGRLYLADIGVPTKVYSRLGIEVPQIFDGRAFLRITRGSAEVGAPN